MPRCSWYLNVTKMIILSLHVLKLFNIRNRYIDNYMKQVLTVNKIIEKISLRLIKFKF